MEEPLTKKRRGAHPQNGFRLNSLCFQIMEESSFWERASAPTKNLLAQRLGVHRKDHRAGASRDLRQGRVDRQIPPAGSRNSFCPPPNKTFSCINLVEVKKSMDKDREGQSSPTRASRLRAGGETWAGTNLLLFGALFQCRGFLQTGRASYDTRFPGLHRSHEEDLPFRPR